MVSICGRVVQQIHAYPEKRLLSRWQAYIEGLSDWHYHRHGGYRAVSVDLTAFFRSQLKGCSSKHYYAPAGKARPAVIMGLVGVTGSLNGQRLAVPREILRVQAQDPSESRLKSDLLTRVVAKLRADEAAVLDAGFKLSQPQQAGVQGFVLRLAKNFTARRNKVAPRKKHGRPPTYGKWVRPLTRSYDGREIGATAPDRVVTWWEGGRRIRAEIWQNLILPGVVPDPKNATFQVLAIYDPLYAQPWLLETDLPLTPTEVKGLYQDHWPVEQIPQAAKHTWSAPIASSSSPRRACIVCRNWPSWRAPSRASWLRACPPHQPDFGTATLNQP